MQKHKSLNHHMSRLAEPCINQIHVIRPRYLIQAVDWFRHKKCFPAVQQSRYAKYNRSTVRGYVKHNRSTIQGVQNIVVR